MELCGPGVAARAVSDLSSLGTFSAACAGVPSGPGLPFRAVAPRAVLPSPPIAFRPRLAGPGGVGWGFGGRALGSAWNGGPLPVRACRGTGSLGRHYHKLPGADLHLPRWERWR